MSLHLLPPDVRELLDLLETGVAPGMSSFAVTYKTGTDVLFTAPHAVRHLTASLPVCVKGSDVGTKELALAAAELYGCAAMATSSPWQGNANADHIESCVFKGEVLRLLRSNVVAGVIDIHGMKDDHGIDVCVGSGGGSPALACAVSDLLASTGLVVAVDEPFSASRPGTVTRTVLEAGFPAVQIEISSSVRASSRTHIVEALGLVVNLFLQRASIAPLTSVLK